MWTCMKKYCSILIQFILYQRAFTVGILWNQSRFVCMLRAHFIHFQKCKIPLTVISHYRNTYVYNLDYFYLSKFGLRSILLIQDAITNLAPCVMLKLERNEIFARRINFSRTWEKCIHKERMKVPLVWWKGRRRKICSWNFYFTKEHNCECREAFFS